MSFVDYLEKIEFDTRVALDKLRATKPRADIKDFQKKAVDR